MKKIGILILSIGLLFVIAMAAGTRGKSSEKTKVLVFVGGEPKAFIVPNMLTLTDDPRPKEPSLGAAYVLAGNKISKVVSSDDLLKMTRDNMVKELSSGSDFDPIPVCLKGEPAGAGGCVKVSSKKAKDFEEEHAGKKILLVTHWYYGFWNGKVTTYSTASFIKTPLELEWSYSPWWPGSEAFIEAEKIEPSQRMENPEALKGSFNTLTADLAKNLCACAAGKADPSQVFKHASSNTSLGGKKANAKLHVNNNLKTVYDK